MLWRRNYFLQGMSSLHELELRIFYPEEFVAERDFPVLESAQVLAHGLLSLISQALLQLALALVVLPAKTSLQLFRVLVEAHALDPIDV